MKYVTALCVLLIALTLGKCSGRSTVTAPAGGKDGGMTEENAIKKVAGDIYARQETFRDKKLAVFNFSNLEGKETPEGTRIAKKLLEELISRGGLIFVERTEIDKLLEAQGLEQTGIVDSDAISITGKVLPVDVMINGTVAQIEGSGEISAKAVNLTTGQIYLLCSAGFRPKEKFSYTENPESVTLFRKQPAKLELINKSFNALRMLGRKAPVLYLLATVEQQEVPKLKAENPALAESMKKMKDSLMQKSPDNWRKILRIREGVSLMKTLAPGRYETVARRKREILTAGMSK